MITFSVAIDSDLTPDQICEGIFDVERWSGFKGYGPIPGIRKASMISPADPIARAEFHVENTDGSKHKETVQFFEPGKCLILRMSDFSPPLRHLTTHFIERWNFADGHPRCRITRTFELYPLNALAWFPLWLIALLLKKAVARHTQQIANPENADE